MEKDSGFRIQHTWTPVAALFIMRHWKTDLLSLPSLGFFIYEIER